MTWLQRTIRPEQIRELSLLLLIVAAILVFGSLIDGYYTSRAGLLEELGYKGNTALGRFPSCTVPEH